MFRTYTITMRVVMLDSVVCTLLMHEVDLCLFSFRKKNRGRYDEARWAEQLILDKLL